jgi:DNA (cytosine-5)-methyltransferase 1
MENKKKLKVFDAFAGYGGATFAMRRANIPHEVVGYSEIKPEAIKLFELNHKGIKNYGDITKINPKDLPDFDLFTGGFPCQTFSTVGKGHGELDTRGTLFSDIIRICEVKQPTFILLENVKGLTTKKHKSTFDKIINELKRIGYNVVTELLNTKDYGLPQNRERIWIFATKKEIPKDWTFAPEKEELKIFFKDLLDKEVDKWYYKSQEQAERLIEITGVSLDVKEPSCFDIYNKKVRTDGISITLTEPYHNTLRIVEPKKEGKYRVRKMTDKEHFRFMGFKDGEIDWGNLSYIQSGGCAGNGWDINLAGKILKKIFTDLG